MGFFAKLILPRRELSSLREEVAELRDAASRIEIQLRQLKLRQDAQEGLHDELAHKVHGRMGGRPRKTTDDRAPETPLPVGVLHLPLKER